ncbi:MAG: hypothetical protein HY854_11440 [Burkholderiales bacterium]|nr:hypothetical protein [Burkholderiales bacterium]
MNTTVHKNLVVLARVLERLERSTVPVDADQYRAVVHHLAGELALAPHDMALEALLDTFPSAAELYENLNYGHYGLCRCDAHHALNAELAARNTIAAIRARSAP